MCGAALRIYLDVSKRGVSALRKMITSIISDLDGALSDQTYKFMALAFKGLQMRLRMTDDETYHMVKEHFSNVALPDGIDLVDAIGKYLSDSRIIEYYDNVPYIREFIDALHEYAKADIEIGVHGEKFTCSIGGFTEGIKELFDLVLQGMS